jgi:fibronectin-binding autotransporter adhesin
MKRRFIWSRLALLAMFIAGAGVPVRAAATDYTWSGSSNTNWTSGGNWQGGTTPTSNGEAVFNSSVTNSAVHLNSSSTQVGEIVFSGSTNASITGTNTLIINGISNIDIDNQTTSFDALFSAPIELGASGTQTFQVGVANSGSASLTFSGGVDLTGTTTVFLAKGASNTITFSSVIEDSSGGATVDLTGAGTVIYSANNTYTGSTTISSGTLQIGSGGTTGSVAGSSIIDNSNLTFDLSSSPTYSGVISGTGNLNQNGSGTLTLSGANTYTGNTYVNSGTLQLGASNVLSNMTDVVVASGATFAMNSHSDTVGSIAGAGNITLGSGALTTGADNSSTTFSGVISGTGGSLTQDGTGTLILTGANTYTGGTTVSAGTLQIGSGGTTGSITGDITDNSNLTYDLSNSTTYSGVISGTGNLNKSGSGTLTLSGVNTFTGNTTINFNSGTLQLGVNNALNSATDVTVNSSSTFALNNFSDTVGSIAGSGNITLGSGTLTTGADNVSTTFSGVISGTGNLNQSGTGTLTLSGANTYTGSTTISSGTLQLGASNAVGSSVDVTVNSGGTFALNNHSDSVGSVAGAGNITLGSGTLTTGVDNASTTFSGVISGTGALTQNGTGTLTLTGANTYTGLTTVTNGVLAFGANNVLASTNSISIASAGTLNLGNFSNTIGVVTGTGIVSFGTSSQLVLTGTGTFSGSFTGTGTLILDAGSNFTLGANFNDTSLNIVLDGGKLNVIGTDSVFGTLTVEANSTLNFSSSSTSLIDFTGVSSSGGGVAISNGVTLSVTNWVNGIDYFQSSNEPGGGKGTAPLDQIVFDSPTYTGGNTTWNTFDTGPTGFKDNEITPVPEPSFYGAIAVALAMVTAVAYSMRRRRPFHTGHS